MFNLETVIILWVIYLSGVLSSIWIFWHINSLECKVPLLPTIAISAFSWIIPIGYWGSIILPPLWQKIEKHWNCKGV